MKVFLAGHKGLVGSAIFRKLVEKKYKNIITIDKKKLNLLNQEHVFKFIKKKKTKCSYYCCCKSRWRLS